MPKNEIKNPISNITNKEWLGFSERDRAMCLQSFNLPPEFNSEGCWLLDRPNSIPYLVEADPIHTNSLQQTAVVKAYDPTEQRLVAIKQIPSTGNSPELEALKRCQGSPHVVTLYETLETNQQLGICGLIDSKNPQDHHLALVMEYLDPDIFPNLDQRLKKFGQIPLYEIALIMSSLADSLKHCKNNGVEYLDLKPGNTFAKIIVGNKQATCQTLFADFGFTNLTHPHGYYNPQTKTITGTPAYLPREGVTGGSLTDSTPVFTMATICYELLTGELFIGSNYLNSTIALIKIASTNGLTREHRNQLKIHQLPNHAIEVLNTALQSKPRKRHKNPHEFAQAFSSAISTTT